MERGDSRLLQLPGVVIVIAAASLLACSDHPLGALPPSPTGEDLATLQGLFVSLERAYESTEASAEQRTSVFANLLAPDDHPRLARYQHVIQAPDTLIRWDRDEDVRRHQCLFREQEGGRIVGTQLAIDPYVLKICNGDMCNLGGGRASISFSFFGNEPFALPGLRWDWVVQWDRGRYYLTGWVETRAGALVPVLWADVLEDIARD